MLSSSGRAIGTARASQVAADVLGSYGQDGVWSWSSFTRHRHAAPLLTLLVELFQLITVKKLSFSLHTVIDTGTRVRMVVVGVACFLSADIVDIGLVNPQDAAELVDVITQADIKVMHGWIYVAVLPSSLDEHPPQVKLHSSVEEARACMLSLGRPSVKLEVSVVALEIAAVPSALKDLQAGRMLPHSGVERNVQRI